MIEFLILLAGLCILATTGRKDHPGLKALQGWAYAHRGLHGNGIPENSMAAFKEALDNGYGIELDIHLTKDGDLAVIHDCSLKRTVGADVKITDLTVAELPNYHLEDTGETIPTFHQVLDLYAGKAPLIIELKADGNNAQQLVDTAVSAMVGYKGVWCMESVDPRCVYWLKKHRPDIVRGQLAENFFRSGSKMPLLHKVMMSWQLTHFLTLPDFVAFKYRDRKNPGTFLSRRLWGAQGVSWTLKAQQELDTAVEEGWIPIFEGFTP